MKGVWNSKKKKYVVVKNEAEKISWVHKNNYVKVGKLLFKGKNTPYVKPVEDKKDGDK